jgi:hypothetical protein
VAEMIRLINSWANKPPMTDEQLLSDTLDWQQGLEGIVPEHRLPDCLTRANRSHKSNFPISLFEIKTAWFEIDAEEKAIREESEAKHRAENRVANCPQKVYHINEHGIIKVVNPFNFSEEIELPCRECRPKAYDEQRTKFIKENGEIKPLEILNNFVNMEDFRKGRESA